MWVEVGVQGHPQHQQGSYHGGHQLQFNYRLRDKKVGITENVLYATIGILLALKTVSIAS